MTTAKGKEIRVEAAERTQTQFVGSKFPLQSALFSLCGFSGSTRYSSEGLLALRVAKVC